MAENFSHFQNRSVICRLFFVFEEFVDFYSSKIQFTHELHSLSMMYTSVYSKNLLL